MQHAQTRIPRFICYVLATLLVSCSLVRADVVTDWNAIALNLAASSENAAQARRTMATVHVAMFETMNFVEGGYVPRFLVEPPVLSGVSSEAAAASAAHHVLVQLYPKQTPALDNALDHSLAGIADSKGRSAGRMTGRHLGASVYAVLASDEFRDAEAERLGSTAELLMWHPIVARLSAAQRLKSIEAARIHALVSMAVNDVYAETLAIGHKSAVGYPCAPCAVGAAVLTILGSEFGPTAVLSTSAMTTDIVRGLALVRASSPRPLWGQPGRDVSYQHPAGVVDERGIKIGMQVLRYFRRVEPIAPKVPLAAR